MWHTVGPRLGWAGVNGEIYSIDSDGLPAIDFISVLLNPFYIRLNCSLDRCEPNYIFRAIDPRMNEKRRSFGYRQWKVER